LTWKQHILPVNTEYNVFWRNITKLGAIGFAKKDYKGRETGAITRMREDLELETLEDRRLSLRLILMYKVVEGLVPAQPTDNFVKLARPKSKTFQRSYNIKYSRETYMQ
jgi:hypothetical protein